MMDASQKHQTRKDAVRQYTIHHAPGAHLTFDDRERLARDWNRLVKNGPMPTLRGFAKSHGIPFATWRREYNRGKTGETVPDPGRADRRTYALYDPVKAQDDVDRGAANKGAPMLFTKEFDTKFTQFVKVDGLSPYDAHARIKEMPEFAGKHIPCVSSIYNHIDRGDIGVHYGETPYHPKQKRRRGPKPHPAKTVPGRLLIDDRPEEADDRSELGHFEMDTIVSGVGGKGGLLVLIDRLSRKYYIEWLVAISQLAVLGALERMKARLGTVRSVTTDNGCEFLDTAALEKAFGCKVYYTRAYASYEKGSVENCNRIVRRWYPKGTDFSLCTKADIRKLETGINSIHRLSLNGKSAAQFDEERRKAA